MSTPTTASSDAGTPRNPLDPKVKTAWRLQTLVSMALPILGALLFLGLGPTMGVPLSWPLIVLLCVLIVLLLSQTIAPELRYRRWRWEVLEEEIRLQEGLIVVSQTVIPMVRVQHVDTSQGPIMGALGLSDVHISTAAGRHTIPALADEHAAQLRDRIAVLARVTDDGGL
ncbi:MAG: PH domain-containing protein [Coriobacteriia bacterium]|nr:PH domain-containing protein [Coriobacteriia bacterium]